MKKAAIILTLVLLSFLWGCNTENVDMLETQRNSIVRYLSNTRGLIPQSRVDSVIENNPAFYNAIGNTVYRHIPSYYEQGRDSRSEIKAGDEVEIIFRAYSFAGSEPSINNMFYSNDQAILDYLSTHMSNPYVKLDWSADPLEFEVGRGDIIKGLDQGLLGCRDKDSIQLYMTSNMAYGSAIIGRVQKNQPQAWYIKILSVKKLFE